MTRRATGGARDKGSALTRPVVKHRKTPEEVVRAGWNELSTVYRPTGARADGTGHRNREYVVWLGPLFRELPRDASVLDLGCGCGEPSVRLLARRFQVTGVDISDVQIRRARSLVPTAHFVRADMSAVRFPPGRFQGVVMLYSLIHVPLRRQLPLLRRIYRWLSPGGLLLAIVGHDAWTARASGWLGMQTEMHWSHTDATTYGRWLRSTGFRILRRRFVPEGDSGHELFLARKPAR